jgi:predicted HAD superfamily Cof-like phosphohydrolase
MTRFLTNAEKIHDFHLALDGIAPERPTLPPPDTISLRQTLLREEYEEVMEAFAQLLAASEAGESADITPLMHELADLLYVTYGAFTAFGVDADAVFAEVHRANMQKANGPRRADGKVLKPADFKSADVAAVLARLARQNGAAPSACTG